MVDLFSKKKGVGNFKVNNWQTVFFANDKIYASRKTEFWKTCVHHHERDNFSTLTKFSDGLVVTLRNVTTMKTVHAKIK